MSRVILRILTVGILGCAVQGSALAGGVTIVTHGFNADMVWVNAMADTIAKRAGTPGVNVTRVNLVVNQVSGNLVVSMTPIAVAPDATFTTSEFVIGLDWTSIDSFRPAMRQPTPEEIADSVPTQNVAQAVFQYLQSWTYGGQSVLAHPVHLAGHSRGGALVASLAKYMGESGVWVDHLTTLDPYPVSLFGDATANVPSSVVFADNLWQDTVFPSGKALGGAFNQHLGNLGSGNHSLVHTFYFGTIDTSATGDGDCTSCISPSWYTTDIDLHARSQSGFWYSRLAGGDRAGSQAAAGLLSTLGGTAVVGTGGRQAVTVSSPAWANVFRVETSQYTVGPQDPNSTHFYYQSSDSSVQVSAYAADDRNPFHGGLFLGTMVLAPAALPTPATLVWNANPPARSQPYSIRLAITDLGPGGRIRYAYDAGQVTVVAAPCPADLNHDGLVDDSDFVSFAAAYDILDCADPAMPAGCPADLNGDNAVDDTDFVMFAAAYDALICP